MKLTEKTITKSIFSYIFFFIFLEPAALQHFPHISTLFKLLHIASFFLVLVFWLPRIWIQWRKGCKSSSERSMICIILGMYYLYLILNTVMHHGMVKSVIFQAVQFLGFSMYLDLVMHHNPRALFKAALNILTLYVLLNMVFVFAIPQGLYATTYYTNNYLLGYDNQNINFILPTLVLVLLKNIYYKKSKLQIYAIYIAAIVTVLRTWSAMSIVVVAVMIVVAVLCNRRNGFFVNNVINGRLFNFRNLLIVNVAMSLGVVFLRIYELFEYLIVVVLKRNLTLTNRVYIWNRTIELIKINPIVGYGKEEYAKRAVKLGYRMNSPAGLHAHNRFLEVMYCGGIVSSLLYSIILVKTAQSLYKYKDSTAAKVISFGLFIYMSGMITEYYDYCILFWGLMVVAEHCEDIVRMKK